MNTYNYNNTLNNQCLHPHEHMDILNQCLHPHEHMDILRLVSPPT